MVYELRLCSNGSYYVYYNNELLTDEKGNYITFSKFEKESALYIISLLNEWKEMFEKTYHGMGNNSHSNNEDEYIEEDIGYYMTKT